jgi:murein DD-endopeptidase MepM/ murein hydrolase activator NlpD
MNLRAAYLRTRYGVPANADVIPELIKEPLSSPTRAAGIFGLEVEGEARDIVKPWLLNYEPTHTQGFHSQHPAHDWAMPSYTRYVASIDGVIRYGYNAGGYAYYYTITNDALGLQVLVAHMPADAQKRGGLTSGTYVRQGQLVGYSDNTGYSTGPHCHMELRRPPYGGYKDCIEFWSRLRNWIGEPVQGGGTTEPPPVTPPPAVDPIKAGTQLIVNTEGDVLNLRAGSGTNTAVIKKLTDGTPLTAAGDQQGKWIPVKYELTGWVHADYVRRRG